MEKTVQAIGSQAAPQRSRRAPIWADVPDAQWDDWRWQLSHRLNTLDELASVLNLTEAEKAGLAAKNIFRVDITPYFASLIDPNDPRDPIRLQVVPTGGELDAFESMMEDSLAEDRHSPVPGLVHRYPDRVLMLVTTQCASYCRYCTRSRIVGDPSAQFSRADYDAQIDYLQRTPQVRDVLLSGGDPLVLPPKILENLLSRLRAIPHIEIVRIGSRVPVFMPQRVTDELCDMLSQYHPLWMNIHVNHPNEVTPELRRACDKLSRAGIPLGNQSVLLAGVNDCVHIQRKLVHERLRGHTSGYAVPQFIIDAPGGGGKVPIMPNYLLSMSDHRVVLRNFEGYITTYDEPAGYAAHDPATCKFCREMRRPEPGQSGLTGLLEGERLAIEPLGFAEAHKRGGGKHRLNVDESKWRPFGLGTDTSPVITPGGGDGDSSSTQS
jgi:lysine 2,3-aminomutase